MRPARRPLVAPTIGLILIGLTAPAARTAGLQAPASDSRAPTAIEQALAEHACGPRTPATTDDDRYRCISDRVDELRGDFGYNLSRLTVARRRAIDRACGPLRTDIARDAYIRCVSGELATMRKKKPAADAAVAPDAAAAAPEADVPPADPQPAAPASNWIGWLIGFLGLGLVAAAGSLVATRVKASRHRCRGCGIKVPPSGDLCPDCRKQAAEALRQAAADRADHERAQAEEKRRQEQEAEQRRARDEAEAQLRREQEERRQRDREEEDARLREEEKRRHEAEGQRQNDPAAAEAAFDPYAILGVSRDAGPDAVTKAYEDARSKYDPTTVSHLGAEVQNHFKAKAEAVERAYQTITGASAPPPTIASSTSA